MFAPEEVAVVILNWNGTAFLEKFLPSVISYADGAGVIVIDNASQDRPELILKERFPSVSWIHLDRNYGFCGGYNRGLVQLNYTYFVLLNSDVEVTEGWLQPLIKAMNSKAQIAACQPKIMDYYHPDRFEYAGAAGGFMDWLGYPFCRGRIFETLEKDQGQYNESIPVFGQLVRPCASDPKHSSKWEVLMKGFLLTWRKLTSAGDFKTRDGRFMQFLNRRCTM